jgi:hypothetical protein
MESRYTCGSCWHLDETVSLVGTTCSFTFPDQVNKKSWCRHHSVEVKLAVAIHPDEVRYAKSFRKSSI